MSRQDYFCAEKVYSQISSFLLPYLRDFNTQKYKYCAISYREKSMYFYIFTQACTYDMH